MNRLTHTTVAMLTAIIALGACSSSDGPPTPDASGDEPMASVDGPSASAGGADEPVASVDGPSASAGGADEPAAPDDTLDGARGQAKITICHRTNGDSAWAEISIAEQAVDAHRNHPWGADIIPAPPDGCPTEPTVPPTEPIVPPTEPTVPPTEPTVPPTEPIVPPTEPTVPPTEPTVPPTEPIVPPTEPIVPPTEPTAPPTEPIVSPTQPPGGLPATSVPTGPISPDSGPEDDELPGTGSSSWILSLMALAVVGAGAAALRVSRRT